MANYYMIGGDGKEYGPVEAAQLRQWVADGRANGLTQVRPVEGGAYTTLGTVPELNGTAAAPPAEPVFSHYAQTAATDYFMRGGDGKEYGPVTTAQLRQWMTEGRANAQTMVRAANGGPYVAMGLLPEFGSTSGARPQSGYTPFAQSLAQNSVLNGGNEGEQIKRLASVLASGSSWIKCLAVFMFISGGLEVLTITGIIIAWIPIWLGVTLWSAASKAQNAAVLGSETEMLGALDKLRFFFKLSVIASIVLLILGVIAMVAFSALAASGLSALGGDQFR